MEDEGGRDRPGGNVEPVRRGGVVRQSAQPARLASFERFELRDPFNDVTHRAKTFEEMTRTADRLGAIKFAAITGDGQRSTVFKVNGAWPREGEQTRAQTPTRADLQPDRNAEPSR